jgi:inhibitor of cysteine peptidase
VAVNGADVTGQDFTGTTYSISGKVTSGGAPLSGVTMTLSGAASKSTTTDANGNYTFTIVGNGSYTVTPSRAGYTFAPVNRPVAVNGADVTGQDFTGTTYSISGKVTSGGAPLSGVTMSLSGITGKATTTNASGDYTFTIVGNGSYTITPSRTGYAFTPVNRSVILSGADVTGQDFTGN